MKIGIIGTAGRGDAAMRLTQELYIRCYRLLRDDLLAPFAPADRELRSGGAAWMDHLAVSLYVEAQAGSLDLFLPCAWNNARSEFVDNGARDFRTNPGGTANHYHRAFSRALVGAKPDYSLLMLSQAAAHGARLHPGRGFFERNLYVGQVDWLIALTFSEGPTPADGGTAHTWKHSRAPWRTHVTLGDVLVVHGWQPKAAP